MKRIILLLMCAAALAAESNIDPLDCHRIEASWAFYRTTYYYAVSGVAYDSPALGIPLSISATLRSYGSFYLISIRSFDLSASASWRFTFIPRTFMLTAGAGGELKARLYTDARSTTASGFTPVITAGAYASFNWCTLSLPLTSRFYSDGMGITLAPEAAARLGFIGVFVRSELSWNTLWAGTGQWYFEHYAGLRFYL